MKIPIYYKPCGELLTDYSGSAFVYGPDLIGFDLRAYVESSPLVQILRLVHPGGV